MSFLNFLRPKKIVALDIGSHTIKLAEFLVKKKKILLKNFAFLPVPEGCIAQEGLMDMDALKGPFSDFMKQHIQAPVSLYATIGGRSVIIKKIEVPRVETEIMNELVETEMRQSLPFNLEDVNYQYETLSAFQPAQEDRVNILLVAAKKDIVNRYDQLIVSSGYKCDRIDVDGFAVSSCMRMAYPEITQKDKNALVLDIGKLSTTFMVLHAGHLIFEHNISVGGHTYNNHLMRQMDVSIEEAESLKLSSCSQKEAPEEVQNIIKESNIQICDEIVIGNEYFNNHFEDLSISSCYITGGGSHLPKLRDVLAEKLAVPVQVLNPLQAVEHSDTITDSLEYIQNFATIPIGLCLRGQEEE